MVNYKAVLLQDELCVPRYSNSSEGGLMKDSGCVFIHLIAGELLVLMQLAQSLGPLNYRTEERTGSPAGQPGWGGGSDRVVYEVKKLRWNCVFPFLDYHWLDPVATAPRFCS
jgi:hypothetical protein